MTTQPARKPDWIAADWGTTNLRLWAMAGDHVIQQRCSDQGMGKLTKAGFEPALVELAGDWIDGATLVVACGMVGSRQGWVEAPYQQTPCAAGGAPMVTAPTTTPGLTVRVIPGVKQSSPADVMRGEETQIAGFLALNPGWDGVICLPGTHTKWVHISADEIVSFQTCMTGDLFAAISGHTVLRHSVTSDDFSTAAFLESLTSTIARPERLAALLFSLRAEGLLNGLPPAEARARLSGLLIGAELAATRPYWLGQSVAVIGTSNVADLYLQALETVGLKAQQTDGDAATLGGLIAAHATIKDTK